MYAKFRNYLQPGMIIQVLTFGVVWLVLGWRFCFLNGEQILISF